jgi:WS/DGAT/MGAT family acyltransferase
MAEMVSGALANQVQQLTHAIRTLPDALGTLAGAASQAIRRRSPVRNLGLAPRTPLNASVTDRRAFAGVTLPLAALKALGKAHGATLNDLVLWLCASALRQRLQATGELPRKSLMAAVPVSLREQGDATSDNQVSISAVSLGTHIADPIERLAHVKAATTAMKAAMGSVKRILPTDFPSLGVPWLIEAAAALYGRAKIADRIPQLANVAISNVPGPPMPLYLAGARLLAAYPTSIVVHGIGLNITVQSYDDGLHFGLMACAAAMPDVRGLADAIRAAFDTLSQTGRQAAKPLAQETSRPRKTPARARPATSAAGR